MMEALRTTLTEFDTIYRKLRGGETDGGNDFSNSLYVIFFD